MKFSTTIVRLITFFIAFSSPVYVLAATNTATDPGGGGTSLTDSLAVTVTATQLALVKQVWSSNEATCYASSDGDTSCDAGGATSINVPSGTLLKFLILVRNTTALALTDIRIQDVLDLTAGVAGGFTYSTGTLFRTPVDGTAPADNATLATIIGATTTVQTDTVSGADLASYSSPNITVGAVVGQVNGSLGFPANKTFALKFTVTKN